jgi:hypothetical protein
MSCCGDKRRAAKRIAPGSEPPPQQRPVAVSPPEAPRAKPRPAWPSLGNFELTKVSRRRS